MVAFNYHSTRARKARLSIRLEKLRPIFIILSILLLIGGTALVISGFNFGYLIASLAAWTYMPAYWFSKHLKHLPIESTSTIDGLLTTHILGKLSKSPSAVEIATLVSAGTSGRFILARFGLPGNALIQIAQMATLPPDQIWTTATALREELGSQLVTSGVLAVAIISLTPNYEQILAHYKLDLDDLKNGVRWYDSVQATFSSVKTPIKTGGIARDWSFGFTPLLDQFGRNISAEISAHGGRTMSLSLPSRRKVVDQMVQIFGGNGRQNVAIVAPSGAGKTSVVHDFAEYILDASAPVPTNLKFRQVFLLSSSAIISAANGRGELETLMSRIFSEAWRAKNVIICLDDAELFFEDDTGAADISNLLLPILEGGRLRLILTMNEQVLLRATQKIPALANAVNRINIPPADFTETMAAMEDRVVQLEYDRKVFYQYQSLKKAYELSERYVFDSVMPGRAIKLLESASNYAENSIITPRSIEQTIEQTVGAKVSVADDAADREKLINLESLIHERMVDQERAVQVVSDALRRARAGVRSTTRPVGTFLFLGPTGVGKTELSKALAEVYYGGEDHLVRLDLNQFVTADSVNDLTADGAINPNSLTASVMKNPFSVVLLDEIEKAHPAVLTALLQVLDEGILRDTLGREVSFRDTIVIATSNAGANEIREMVASGQDITRVNEHISDLLISSGDFRPEFLNRFDEMVVFGPLSKENLLKVVDLMVAGVNKTLAAQKITVTIDPEAKSLLVEAGYDPRLGARPMRRVIQRVVENEVAKQTLAGTVTAGGTVHITPTTVQANLANAQ